MTRAAAAGPQPVDEPFPVHIRAGPARSACEFSAYAALRVPKLDGG